MQPTTFQNPRLSRPGEKKRGFFSIGLVAGDIGRGGEGGAPSMALAGTACLGKGRVARAAIEAAVAATRFGSISTRSLRGLFCTPMPKAFATVSLSHTASTSWSLAPFFLYASSAALASSWK
jgi:hypothetical protein